MKPYSLKHCAFLLLALFTLSSVPAFASTATTPGNASASYSTTVAAETGQVVKKKSEKRGFFSKLKNFGKKAKMFVKAITGEDHSTVVAILLALFLGGLGIHRVYLGGRPILILLYIITFGGIFGILPLIDLIRLIIGHRPHYEGNDKFFAAFS